MSLKSELKHLEGLPPYLMMLFEARLKVRIRQVMDADVERNVFGGPTLFYERLSCYHPYMDIVTWRKLDDAEVDELARHILYRLMEKRMNEGRQFDSILAASTKAFGHMMINKVLQDKAGDTLT